MVSQVVLTARLILINKILRSGDPKRAKSTSLDLMYRTWKKAVLSYLFRGPQHSCSLRFRKGLSFIQD